MKKCSFETVGAEIRKEKADSLGRAGERLERALQELRAVRQELFDLLAAAPESLCDGKGRFSGEFEWKVTEYARLCERTKALRHALILQREAVGIWSHEEVDRQYPLPGPLSCQWCPRTKVDR